VSIPDVTVDIRIPYEPFVGSSLVIIEDRVKEDDGLNTDGDKVSNTVSLSDLIKSGEFQLPGEMLSAAMHNYKLYHEPQTIFALRVVGKPLRDLQLRMCLFFSQTLNFIKGHM
jgi:hypothetical protein